MRRLELLFCFAVILIHPIIAPAPAHAASAATTAAPVVESEPETAQSQVVDTGQVAGGIVIAVAAVFPPTLPMMAFLGLPQPGAVAAGGGKAPVSLS